MTGVVNHLLGKRVPTSQQCRAARLCPTHCPRSWLDAPPKTNGTGPPLDPNRGQIEIFVRALFKHAAAGSHVSLRSFYDDDSTRSFEIQCVAVDNRDDVVDAAYHQARRAANAKRKIVFCPPVATFSNTEHARKEDIADGLTLSAECDEKPQAARALLEKLLGPATIVVASGGEWLNPDTGELEPKLHLHWRLRKPAREDDRGRLEEARKLVIKLVGSDPSHAPISHPIRWPGSIHRKGEPKLCRIVAENPEREINLDAAFKALKEAVNNNPYTAHADAQAAPANWGELIGAIVSAKSYHVPLTRLAAKAITHGMSNSATVNLLEGLMDASTGPRDDRWRARRGEIPRSADTAMEKFGSAGNGINAPGLVATPYAWRDPAKIFPRDFLYGKHLIRKFLSGKVSQGGVGKSTLIAGETLAMVSGRNLLGVIPSRRLRVWLWNLEDPKEETERKIQAAALHYNLLSQDIEPYLFIDSGRDQKLVIAETTRDGARIVRPVVDSLIEQVIARNIDVLIIDPFVSSHRVIENSNDDMDLVVKQWSAIAELGNCAVELVHHSKKGELEKTVESSRGAIAITDACRSVQVLNRMTKEEAERAGVQNYRLYFRVYADKANLAPPLENSNWFKLENVSLGNGPHLGGMGGDEVGVIVTWQWPDAMAGITGADFEKVASEIRTGKWRENSQAKEWAGLAVAKALNLDAANKTDRARIGAMLKVWLAAKLLVVVDGFDEKSMPKKFVEVAEKA